MSTSAIPAHDVDMATRTPSALPTGSSSASNEVTSSSLANLEERDQDATSIITNITTTGRKQPPPEKPSHVRRRSFVILSFWLIVLCLGLPIWWKTTAIPRANLPLDEMMDWADGKVRQLPLLFS